MQKQLGPLFQLEKAENLSGIARGLAFQVVESLGVLDEMLAAGGAKRRDICAQLGNRTSIRTARARGTP